MSEPPPVLALRSVRKDFGAARALDAATIELAAGEIHGVIGENGAGKSTLMNVAAGLVRPDAGSIEIDGRPAPPLTPRRATELGVRMVHQHFKLVPSLTVEENYLLSRSGSFLRGLLGLRAARVRARAAIESAANRLRFPIRPDARIEDLSVGEQQRAEIVKAIDETARVLILDEPTAVLTPLEVEPLFASMRRLRDEGLAIALVGHKLREVLSVCDRFTVLARGRVVATRRAAETSASELLALMIGEGALPLDAGDARDGDSPGRGLLEVEGLAARDEAGRRRLRHATFTVRAGEIFAIVGVDGNGQRELAFAVAGLRPPDSGTISFEGRRVERAGRPRARHLGMALVPDDRREHGLFLDLSIAENLCLGIGASRALAGRGPLLARSAITDFARGLARRFDVRARDVSLPAGALSGGNQQKLVLARETADDPLLLIAMNPTRGLDVGATRAIHDLLRARGRDGRATLLVTSDLDEALALADRVGVLYGGELAHAPAGAGRDEIGALMTGAD